MSVRIVEGGRASEPYRWRQVAEEPISNGVEPSHQIFGGVVVDTSLVYPGLPTLEGLTPPEPRMRVLGAAESEPEPAFIDYTLLV